MEQKTIELADFLYVLKKWFWLIIILCIVGAASGFVISKEFMTPIYESQSQLVIKQEQHKNDTTTTSETQSNIQLVNTYKIILVSPTVLETVIKSLDLPETTEQLSKQILIENSKDSQVLTVNVLNADRELAKQINQQLIKAATKESDKIMSANNIRVLTEPTENMSPVKPNKTLVIGVGFLVGFLVAISIIVIKETMRQHIRDEKELRAIIKATHLGNINQF
ncbi:acyl-CoA thioester hydrolase [Listeria grandensis FSL F6-0971]|uniref:Acyl-CoA thioester hydrolase n=1 Tax=Listeria grandensis FSL F6-0971 TaxID=1265819 RepID=W7B9E8_9LIST|nr:Wzz/FepE/Etk N-terminal domain-containing protein [Listeria grandensis]EUJ23939.1 acyl-CoA thioester hydrolase [Listeria grandensis FSL F6-0971]